jgi:hypothetical protein
MPLKEVPFNQADRAVSLAAPNAGVVEVVKVPVAVVLEETDEVTVVVVAEVDGKYCWKMGHAGFGCRL